MLNEMKVRRRRLVLEPLETRDLFNGDIGTVEFVRFSLDDFLTVKVGESAYDEGSAKATNHESKASDPEFDLVYSSVSVPLILQTKSLENTNGLEQAALGESRYDIPVFQVLIVQLFGGNDEVGVANQQNDGQTLDDDQTDSRLLPNTNPSQEPHVSTNTLLRQGSGQTPAPNVSALLDSTERSSDHQKDSAPSNGTVTGRANDENAYSDNNSCEMNGVGRIIPLILETDIGNQQDDTSTFENESKKIVVEAPDNTKSNSESIVADRPSVSSLVAEVVDSVFSGANSIVFAGVFADYAAIESAIGKLLDRLDAVRFDSLNTIEDTILRSWVLPVAGVIIATEILRRQLHEKNRVRIAALDQILAIWMYPEFTGVAGRVVQ